MNTPHKPGLQAITHGRTKPETTQNKNVNTPYTKIHPTNTTSRPIICRNSALKNKTQTMGLYKPNITRHIMIS
jgi:hypothetical protein